MGKPGKKACGEIWFGRQITSMGYKIVKSQTAGKRERYICGKMNKETKELMGVLDE